MEDFRHNLTPVEVKKFLKSTSEYTENLLIHYCYKVPISCPKCGAFELCKGGAVSLYSSSLDKITHEISACLNCGYKQLSMVSSIESL